MSAPVTLGEGVSQIESILDQARDPSPDESSSSRLNKDDPDSEDELGSEDELDPEDDLLEGDAADEGEGEDEDEADAEEDAGEESGITSFAALAEDFGTDEEGVLGAIHVDNGFGEEFSVGAALEDWRDLKANLLQKNADLEQAYQAREKELGSQITDTVKQVSAMASTMAAELKADFEGVDLELLKAEDPLKYVDMMERRQRRTAMIRDALSAMNGESARREGAASETLSAHHHKEAALLRQKKPQWFKKPEVIQSVVDTNMAYMRELGFQDADIAAVTDHRHIIALYEGAQWRESQRNAEGKSLTKVRAKKGLRRPDLGKRSVSREDPGNQREVKQKAGLKRVRNTGKLNDGAAAIRAMLKPA